MLHDSSTVPFYRRTRPFPFRRKAIRIDCLKAKRIHIRFFVITVFYNIRKINNFVGNWNTLDENCALRHGKLKNDFSYWRIESCVSLFVNKINHN